MSKKLTIIVCPSEGVGHVNACIGVSERLRDRGHRIIFVLDKAYEGKLLRYGFEEEILENLSLEFKKPGEEITTYLPNSGLLSGLPSIEKMEIMYQSSYLRRMIDKRKSTEQQRKAILEKYKPDIIIIDDLVGVPSLMNSNIPWIFLDSRNPLTMIADERTPPGRSGYPIDSNKSEWKRFEEIKQKCMTPSVNYYNEWMSELGLPHLKNDRCIPESPYLNVYGFPQELDYTDVRPVPHKWFRVDSHVRKSEQEQFDIPDKFKNRDQMTQKLIYLSLGSMASVDIDLMKRLVNILSKSPHKYIVSKGLLGDKYELADNMWGQNSVPQTKVLPLIDLVITHGGNNTVTETFSFGKPMIVLPMFLDQFDNAQRIQEKGFGIRLEPYSCTEQELLGAIEKLLNDVDLKERLELAAKRISEEKSLEKLSEKIEKLVNN